MEVYGIIYMHTNKINGKSYIGQTTKTMEKRLWRHVNDAKHGSTTHFHRAIIKYGIDNFESKIIDTATSQNGLDVKEQYWIMYYDTFKNGYNCNIGGGSCKGYKLNDEQVKIIKERQTGKTNSFYGKHHSKETIEKLKEINKGSNNGNAKAIKAYNWKKDGNHEFIGEFGCAREFVKYAKDKCGIELAHQSIAKVLKGKYGSTKGFWFEYVSGKENTKEILENKNNKIGVTKGGRRNVKPIKAFLYDINGNHKFIGYYECSADFVIISEKEFGIKANAMGISRVCKKQIKYHKIFYFEYAN